MGCRNCVGMRGRLLLQCGCHTASGGNDIKHGAGGEGADRGREERKAKGDERREVEDGYRAQPSTTLNT